MEPTKIYVVVSGGVVGPVFASAEHNGLLQAVVVDLDIKYNIYADESQKDMVADLYERLESDPGYVDILSDG
jgi:hypothetical protein